MQLNHRETVTLLGGLITETERRSLSSPGNPQLNMCREGVILLLALQEKGTIYVHSLGSQLKGIFPPYSLCKNIQRRNG